MNKLNNNKYYYYNDEDLCVEQVVNNYTDFYIMDKSNSYHLHNVMKWSNPKSKRMIIGKLLKEEKK